MASLTTNTRRGLVLDLYAEAILVCSAVIFIAFPDRPAALVWGVVLSGAVGLPAGLMLWSGRHEFGDDHARLIARAGFVFAVTVTSLLLAYFQLTSIFPESLQLRDLRGPWFFLALALLADGLAIALFLWHLAGSSGRPWIFATLVLALLGAIVVLVLGWIAVEDYLQRSGGVAAVRAEADSYVRDFTHDVVRWFAAGLVAMRVTYLPALYLAITNVAEAEAEASEAASTTGS